MSKEELQPPVETQDLMQESDDSEPSRSPHGKNFIGLIDQYLAREISWDTLLILEKEVREPWGEKTLYQNTDDEPILLSSDKNLD